MRKQFLYILLVLGLFSCNRNISIEKKWVTTDNNYLLLTQPDDSLSYHWEGGVFENVINGKGILSAYYAGRQISSKTIEAYYGATSKEDVLDSNGSKYIGSIVGEKYAGFAVLVKSNKIYIGNFLEGQPNGYLSYYVNNKLSYRGEWQNGKRWGRGADYDENGKIVSGIWKDNKIFETDTTITFEEGVYKGLLRNSLPQGYGTMNYFSNEQYNGNWDKGRWQGEGCFTSATDTIIGEFSQGKLNGYGIYKTINFILEGDFKDDKPNGQAYILFSDSTFYSGDWTNGKINGNGDIMLSNGDTYMGGWKDNQYNGEGRYNYHTGEVYDGHWKNGLQDSLGKYTCKDYTYLGNWEEGYMNGHGKITYPNGDYYEGDFVENQKYGIGYYHFKDGNAYDGEFVNGIFNGLGIFTFKDGSSYQGEFRDGKIKGDGTLFLKEGKETIAITANWDGSTKFPKKASVLFENGDLYEGELDSSGFPTKNGVWTSAQDREKGITVYDKANEFYKSHKETWNSIVNYTSSALIVVAAVAAAPVAIAAIATVVVVNVADAGVAVVHSEIEIKNANGDRERIAEIKAERNAELLDNGVNIASALTVGYANSAKAATEVGKATAKEAVKTSAKQGLKTAGKNMLRNIDGQDVIDMTEAVIKKDKNGMLLTAGAVVAGAVVNVKLPKTSPIRKSIVKLSTVARQVGKSAIHFANNKTFGKVVKIVKNSSGVIEKQWVKTTIKGVKEGSERLTKFVHHSFKSSIHKVNLKQEISALKKKKGKIIEGDRTKINKSTLESDALYKLNNEHHYATDHLGRVEEVIGELKLDKTVERNKSIQRKSVHEKDGNFLTKSSNGEKMSYYDQGGHLIGNRFGGVSERINLVPMDSNINQRFFKEMEDEWAKEIELGKKVWVDIKIEYEGKSYRPRRFIVNYTIDGEKHHRRFGNGYKLKY